MFRGSVLSEKQWNQVIDICPKGMEGILYDFLSFGFLSECDLIDNSVRISIFRSFLTESRFTEQLMDWEISDLNKSILQNMLLVATKNNDKATFNDALSVIKKHQLTWSASTLRTDFLDPERNTALHWAFYNRNCHFIEALLASDFPIKEFHLENSKGQKPLALLFVSELPPLACKADYEAQEPIITKLPVQLRDLYSLTKSGNANVSYYAFHWLMNFGFRQDSDYRYNTEKQKPILGHDVIRIIQLFPFLQKNTNGPQCYTSGDVIQLLKHVLAVPESAKAFDREYNLPKRPVYFLLDQLNKFKNDPMARHALSHALGCLIITGSDILYRQEYTLSGHGQYNIGFSEKRFDKNFLETFILEAVNTWKYASYRKLMKTLFHSITPLKAKNDCIEKECLNSFVLNAWHIYEGIPNANDVFMKAAIGFVNAGADMLFKKHGQDNNFLESIIERAVKHPEVSEYQTLMTFLFTKLSNEKQAEYGLYLEKTRKKNRSIFQKVKDLFSSKSSEKLKDKIKDKVTLQPPSTAPATEKPPLALNLYSIKPLLQSAQQPGSPLTQSNDEAAKEHKGSPPKESRGFKLLLLSKFKEAHPQVTQAETLPLLSPGSLEKDSGDEKKQGAENIYLRKRTRKKWD